MLFHSSFEKTAKGSSISSSRSLWHFYYNYPRWCRVIYVHSCSVATVCVSVASKQVASDWVIKSVYSTVWPQKSQSPLARYIIEWRGLWTHLNTTEVTPLHNYCAPKIKVWMLSALLHHHHYHHQASRSSTAPHYLNVFNYVCSAV